MNLLIDCGNSSLKLALSKDLVIDESYSIEFRQIRTFKDNVKRLLTRIKRQNKLDGIYIIYVNKEMKDLITPILLDILVKTPIKLLNRRSFKTFNLKYKNLSSFGIDRFYNCLGGKALYKSSNLILVDMGTATTIDVISKEFNYLGGIILPGSLTALSSLINKTSLIGNHSILVDDKLLGLSTKECLSSGFVNGQVRMIKGIIDEIIRTHQISFKVILTGGVSNLFLSFFPEYEFDSNLLFKGMAFKLLEDL